MPKLFMMIGLPRRGKSTFIRKNKMDNEVVISADRLREKIYGQRYFKGGEDYVWAVRKTMLKEICDQGVDIWVDETNTTRHRRSKTIEIAQEYDYNIQAIVMYTRPSTCLKRCSVDELEDVIKRQFKQWEDPMKNEGFGLIQYVTEPRTSKREVKEMYRHRDMYKFIRIKQKSKGINSFIPEYKIPTENANEAIDYFLEDNGYFFLDGVSNEFIRVWRNDNEEEYADYKIVKMEG